jgi:hypothetical protein
MSINVRMIIRSAIVVLIAGIAISVLAIESFAHSGGTNADGCHTNRKTGEYHCHRKKTPAPGRISYCHVLAGEYRCGYAKTTCEDLKKQFGGKCVVQ